MINLDNFSANFNYIICPRCQQKLLKAANGSVLEIKCHKCYTVFAVEVKNDEIIIKKIERKEE